MNAFKSSISESFYALRSTRAIALTSMLIALSVAMHFFTVPLTDVLQLRFTFVPIAATGMLFGPVVGAAAGLISDLLKFIIRPTGAFHAGFTLNELLTGFIYGLVFFKKEITLARAVAAEFIVSLVIHILLSSIWLRDLYEQGIIGILPVRILKTSILFPLNVVLLMMTSKVVRRAKLTVSSELKGL